MNSDRESKHHLRWSLIICCDTMKLNKTNFFIVTYFIFERFEKKVNFITLKIKRNLEKYIRKVLIHQRSFNLEYILAIYSIKEGIKMRPADHIHRLSGSSTNRDAAGLPPTPFPPTKRGVVDLMPYQSVASQLRHECFDLNADFL